MPDLPQMDELNTTPNESLPVLEPEDDLSRPYGALKCAFRTPKRGDVFGAFCFLFNGTTGEALDNVFWVTRSCDDFNVNVRMGWRELNKVIPAIGPYEKSLGERLQASLLETFPPHVRIDLVRRVEGNGPLMTVGEELRKNFERASRYFLEFEIDLERLARKDLVDAGILPPEKENAETEGEEKSDTPRSFEGLLVHCLPLIDPVRGKAVSDLRPGDLVEVKIQSGVGPGGLIHQYLASTNQEAVFPVESVEKKDDDKTYIFLTINEEIRGLITVSKDLRLRTLQIGGDRKAVPSVNTDTVIFLGTLAVAAGVIFWVVRHLFF